MGLLKIWKDTTQNRDTGHYVALDLMKAVCFMTGIFLTIFAAVAKFTLLALVIYANYSDRFVNIDVPMAPGIVLLSFGMGGQITKIAQSYINRLSSDMGGNVLATPGSAEVPPPYQPTPMPQGNIASPPLPTS